MKIIQTILKIFLRAVLYFFLAIIVAVMLIYFIAPVYDFPVPKKFSGDTYYNPYAGCDKPDWKKANFHYHSRAWGGITSGRENNYEDFYRIYRTGLGYDYPEISNYQWIDPHFRDSAFYIPCYEHGLNAMKKHQLMVGARKVLWFDYPVYQNLNHKQHILNILRDQGDLVTLAHPDWQGGYSKEDLKFLTNYDLIEVLDANWRSVPLWDAALSAGRPAFILADDDAHDLGNPMEVGTCCTFIYSDEPGRQALMLALKEGRAFGADIYNDGGETFDTKAVKAQHFPSLEYVKMKGDTLCVKVSTKAFRFTFIGQNGKIRKLHRYADSAFYVFDPGDTYIRTEIAFFNRYKGPGTTYYLNPVFRYSGERPDNSLKAEVNGIRTWIFRLFSIPSLFVLIGLIIWYQRKRQLRKIVENGQQ